jgi:hypothetical protein
MPLEADVLKSAGGKRKDALIAVIPLHLLRSDDPGASARAASHFTDFLSVSVAVVITGNPEGGGVGYGGACLCSEAGSKLDRHVKNR